MVFFMHGILDTSMGWVSNGVTGSQAFAAFDQGFDVWLGNSRANPPRLHESERSLLVMYPATLFCPKAGLQHQQSAHQTRAFLPQPDMSLLCLHHGAWCCELLGA